MKAEGPQPVVIDEEEKALLKVYREVRSWGFGRIEVVIVQGRLETITPALIYKRKDLIFENEASENTRVKV